MPFRKYQNLQKEVLFAVISRLTEYWIEPLTRVIFGKLLSRVQSKYKQVKER